MKTYDEIQQIMQGVSDTTGIPCTFLVFDTPQKAPYAIIRQTQSHNVSSDFKTLDSYSDWEIWFYYRKAADRIKLEHCLMDLPIVWERTSSDAWIDSDRIWESTYDIS